jgi:hypothetical protein
VAKSVWVALGDLGLVDALPYTVSRPKKREKPERESRPLKETKEGQAAGHERAVLAGIARCS